MISNANLHTEHVIVLDVRFGQQERVDFNQALGENVTKSE